MLALQTVVIGIALFTVIMHGYAASSQELGDTKVMALRAEHKRFWEHSLEISLKNILTSEPVGATCLDRKRNAAAKVKQLAQSLEKIGIETRVGRLSNNECNCIDPWQVIVEDGEELYATAAILSCVGNELVIDKAGIGSAAISFTFSRDGSDFNIIKNGEWGT